MKTEREKFEQWVRRETAFDLERDADGEYAYGGAHDHWTSWQARAAIDSRGEGANPDWLIPMARRALHIAFVWNDHNYPSCRNMALDTAEEYGIKSFEDANTVLKSVYAATPSLADAGKETPELIPGVNDALAGLTIKV